MAHIEIILNLKKSAQVQKFNSKVDELIMGFEIDFKDGKLENRKVKEKLKSMIGVLLNYLKS